MRKRLLWGFALGLAGALPSLSPAQVPAVPGAPAAPGAAAPAAPAAAPAAGAAAGAGNIWSFFCMTPEQKAACKKKFCESGIGQLLNNSLRPAGALTGGIIGPCCPLPGVDPNNINMPADSALGAAAKIAADTAAAKARRAAVRYLGTVDCNYWPEAEAALINSLRADRNECVRLEAAHALNRGCCCTKKIMKALILTVTGSKADNNPAECSERVKVLASMALMHCLNCFVEVEPAKDVPPKIEPRREEPKREVPGKEGAGKVSARGREPGYYDRVELMSRQQLIAEARQALAENSIALKQNQAQTAGLPRGGLVDIIGGAFASTKPAGTPAPAQPAPVPAAAPTPPRRGLVDSLWEKVAGPKETTPPAPAWRPAPQQPARPVQPVGAVVPQTHRPAVPVSSLAPQTATPARAVAAANLTHTATTSDLLYLVQFADDPFLRESAARQLSRGDATEHARIVNVLLDRAARDQAALVRAACLRSLAALKVHHSTLAGVLRQAQADGDPRVRLAAAEVDQSARAAAPISSH